MTDASPLAEVSETSLDDLFASDPLGLAEQDIDRIVEELRAKRALWRQEEAAGAKKSKAKALAGPKLDLKIEDLDL